MRFPKKIAMTICCLSCGVALAAPGKGQGKGPRPFESFDKDGNKELTKEEVATAPQIGGDFDVIDTDKSGSISKDELEAYRTAQHAQRMKSN